MPYKRWTVTSEKILSREQIQTLIEYLTQERDLAIARGNKPQAIRDYYMLHLMLESGVRVEEFCDLKISDFAGLKLLIRNGKGGKARTILLTRPTANRLKEWVSIMAKLGFPSGPEDCLFPSRYKTPYTTRGIFKRVKLIFSTLGFPKRLSPHSIRHTYCTLLLEAKIGLGTVRDNMGHSSISVTNIYSHTAGSIENVEVFGQSSSEIFKKSELANSSNKAGANKTATPVKSFLRNQNFK